MTTTRCVCTSNDTLLCELLDRARERVVFVAPGMSERVAKTLTATWHRLGPEAVSVVLDVDPEIYRLGYGEEGAIDVLQRCADELNQSLCEQPGIRLGLLVVDDRTLVYSPTPRLVEPEEAPPRPLDSEMLGELLSTPSAPPPMRMNAILLGGTLPELARELGSGPEGESTRTVGLDQVDAGRIQSLHADLKGNPPLKFDVARYERVFNAQLEFVEMEVLGCAVSRRTASIPSELIGLARDEATRSRLRSSFKVLGENDVVDAEGKLSEKAIHDERKRISTKYLKTLANYGTVILRSNRPAFEAEVEKLQTTVKTFGEQLRAKLDDIIKANVNKLADALLPSVLSRPPEHWTSSLGAKPTPEESRAQLEADLQDAFGTGAALVAEMKVKVLFKGITYQTLKDERFVHLAKAKFPRLRLLEEFQAAPEVQNP